MNLERGKKGKNSMIVVKYVSISCRQWGRRRVLGRPHRCTSLEAGGATSLVTRRWTERITITTATHIVMSRHWKREQELCGVYGKRNLWRMAGKHWGAQKNNCDKNNETCNFKSFFCICDDCDVTNILGQPTVKGYKSVRHEDRPLAICTP